MTRRKKEKMNGKKARGEKKKREETERKNGGEYYSFECSFFVDGDLNPSL
jgi:hypothetical protein